MLPAALLLHRGLTSEELNKFTIISGPKREQINQHGDIEQVWAKAGIAAMTIRTIRYDLFQAAEEGSPPSGRTDESGEGLWDRFAGEDNSLPVLSTPLPRRDNPRRNKFLRIFQAPPCLKPLKTSTTTISALQIKGARYLLETTGVPRLAVIVAYEHHLKFSLSGYPNVSQNWQQNICSHMTTISDFFDALRTRRSYREPMHMREIAGMMLDMMGTELHPVLARNFLRILSGLVETDN